MPEAANDGRGGGLPSSAALHRLHQAKVLRPGGIVEAETSSLRTARSLVDTDPRHRQSIVRGEEAIGLRVPIRQSLTPDVHRLEGTPPGRVRQPTLPQLAHVPQLHRPVEAPAEQPIARVAEAEAADFAGRLVGRPNEVGGVDGARPPRVPHLNAAVGATQGYEGATAPAAPRAVEGHRVGHCPPACPRPRLQQRLVASQFSPGDGVHVPNSRRPVVGGGGKKVSLQRVPGARVEHRHVALRHRLVGDVLVTFDRFRLDDAVPVDQLRVAAAADDQQHLSVGVVLQVADGMGLTGLDGAKGLQRAVHALKVPELDLVVDAAGDEAGAVWVEG